MGLRLCVLTCGEAENKGGGPAWAAAWSTHGAGLAMLPERAECIAHQLALTHGEQGEGSSSFGWKDNICCSWLFLRQVRLRSGGQVQVFEGLDSVPGLSSPHCFKL